ncbi:MAG: hypothetical protein U0736_01315 [Gemmataceae bacterium]
MADVLTVMARTPGAGGSKEGDHRAFLMTPDLPGFKVVEARMAKNSIRGTATGRLAFEHGGAEANVLGQLGRGCASP